MHLPLTRDGTARYPAATSVASKSALIVGARRDAGSLVAGKVNRNCGVALRTQQRPDTVTLLGPRTAPLPLDDPGNGVPAGATSCDGSAYVSSGFLLLGKTYRLTFAKPGIYTDRCLIAVFVT